MTPFASSEAASAARASSSKRLRGWCGFGAIVSTAIWRSSARSSPPAASGETLRIAARPRPMPVGLATGGHLLGELEVRVGAGAVRVVVDHRDAEARRLADAHVARDDRVEDERREVLADLSLHVA